MYEFTASTVPGCRTPHFWLGDGRSLYDAMGDGFALLRFDAAIDVSDLEAAAAARSVPFKTIDATFEQAGAPYREKLIVSRPDQHIAWRGDKVPLEPGALIDRIIGASST
jgi:hypothetical protein